MHSTTPGPIVKLERRGSISIPPAHLCRKLTKIPITIAGVGTDIARITGASLMGVLPELYHRGRTDAKPLATRAAQIMASGPRP